jgi:hypothetical protein
LIIPCVTLLPSITLCGSLIFPALYNILRARMAELADAQDLGSCTLRCGGSSPPSRTMLFQWGDENLTEGH